MWRSLKPQTRRSPRTGALVADVMATLPAGAQLDARTAVGRTTAGPWLTVDRSHAGMPGADRRVAEPVTLGLPMPAGFCANAAELRLFDGDGSAVAFQSRVLERWSDGT